MSSVARKISTMGRVARTRGPASLAALVWEKARMWWRRDDRTGLSRLFGRPNELVRLDGCRFDAGGGAAGRELREMMLRGLHEKPEREALARFLDPDAPVVEFGACIGVVSCLVNRRLADKSRHVVVEANADLLPTLAGNRDRNDCRFEIVHAAVAYGAREVTFHVAEDPLSSRVGGELPAASRAVTVPAVTLAEVLDGRGFERCTLVCDIEGAEVELIRRERGVLAGRVSTLIIETHDRLLGDAAPPGGTKHAVEELGFEAVYEGGDVYVFRNLLLTKEETDGTS